MRAIESSESAAIRRANQFIISIATLTQQQKSKSGLATHLTAKIWKERIQRTAALNLSYRDVNLGEEEHADAAIHLLHGNDSQPTRPESACRVAI
jgi:hypothetical protein